MTPPRTTYLEYHIARVRLINFHNFVNETIELRKGGHLFLVGPNGSGKSTVVDAIHTVLSGAQDLELNAAARLGGRKDEGRTLQGVVLRYDRELGPLNESGGISYAALELASANGEKRLCLGVGLEARTMEARLSRWGFLVRNCSVNALPLLIDEPQGQRPATKAELEGGLGKANVYGQSRAFRKKIAEEFFASEFLYEQVAHLWNTGKAYREICARAGDFQTLFMTLLPEPDTEIFSEILSSLGRLQDFALRLENLAEQLRFIERLTALQEKIAGGREEEARYDWLISYRELKACQAHWGGLQQKLEHVQERAQALETQLAQLHVEHERIKTLLADLRHKDEAHLLERLRNKKSELERHARMLTTQQAQLRAHEERLRRAQQEVEERRGEVVAAIELAQAAITQAGQSLQALPLPAGLAAFVEDFTQTPVVALIERRTRPEATPALRETAALLANLSQERLELQHELAQHEERRHKIVDALDQLKQQREWLPQLPNYHQCVQLLENKGLAPQPLYKMLEWRSTGADLRAALEELLGQQLLGALVLNDGEAERIRATVLQEFPGIAVLEPGAESEACPEWIANALEDRAGGMALRLIGNALAARVSQRAEYAPELHRLGWRGLRWKAEGRPARLIGADARQQAFAQEMAQRQEELLAGENLIAACRQRLQYNAEMVQHWRVLEEALQKVQEDEMSRAWREHETALLQASTLQQSYEEWSRSYAMICEEHEGLNAAVQQLEQHLTAAGLHELAREIETAEQRERGLEEKIRSAAEERGQWRNESARLQNEISAQGERLQQLDEVLQAQALRLRAWAGPELAPDLEYYVLSTRGGERFKSEEAIHERKKKAHDEVNVALAQLQGTGEEGIHYRQYAGIFGFSYLAEANKIVDRQFQPLAGVHARLQQDHAEQQEILNEENKKLLDQLIMESLARHLHEQVTHQRRMIKSINRLLRDLDFGGTIYDFEVHARPEHKEIAELVENFSWLDESRRQNFRAFIEARLSDLRESEPGTVPALLDYRTWFDYKLRFRDTKTEATELTRHMRQLGSGGEQAVPNYLLVLAMAHLVFQNSRARLRPMLFDEAFYGIDAGRRDRLLEFATNLGMQLFVASPDQDGHTPAVRYATTVFVQKDENRDVHLTAINSHFRGETQPQQDLLAEAAIEK